jgi:hypothetical protein
MKRRTEWTGKYWGEGVQVELEEWEAPWMDTETVDAAGRQLEAGQYVVRAIPCSRAVSIEVRRVREVKNGKVYLNTSKTAIIYPCRMLILDNWPVN